MTSKCCCSCRSDQGVLSPERTHLKPLRFRRQPIPVLEFPFPIRHGLTVSGLPGERHLVLTTFIPKEITMSFLTGRSVLTFLSTIVAGFLLGSAPAQAQCMATPQRGPIFSMMPRMPIPYMMQQTNPMWLAAMQQQSAMAAALQQQQNALLAGLLQQQQNTVLAAVLQQQQNAQLAAVLQQRNAQLGVVPPQWGR